MSVEFDRESPGKFDSRTLSRTTLSRWTGRSATRGRSALPSERPLASRRPSTGENRHGIYIYIYIYVHVSLSLSIYIYIYIYICMHAYMGLPGTPAEWPVHIA